MTNIVELAKLILENATIYEQHFSSNGLPSPSLEASAFPAPNLPGEVTAIRDAAIEACTNLQAILRGPVGVVRSIIAMVYLVYLSSKIF